jgi:hypothetical protein
MRIRTKRLGGVVKKALSLQLRARPPWPLLPVLPLEEKFDVSSLLLPEIIGSTSGAQHRAPVS